MTLARIETVNVITLPRDLELLDSSLIDRTEQYILRLAQ